MAVGFWRKVKNAASNVFNTVKKVASFVNDNIVKPILPAASQVLSNFGFGGIAKGIQAASNITSGILNKGENTSPQDMIQNVIPVLRSNRIVLK